MADKTVQKTISVDPKVYKQAKIKANQLGWKFSTFIGKALVFYMEQAAHQ